ncbi:MAG: ribosomal protein S18-alanine N-acetyltransferase [Aestuariibacter sp.]
MESVKNNPMNLDFTKIDEANYSSAFQLQRQCHAFPWSENMFKDCLTPPYFAEQLLMDDQVTGYYVGLLVSVEATLMDIGIDESMRGNGLGKLLLQRFLRECNAKQAQEAWLEVRQSNAAAIKMYQDFDFQLIETRKDYYPAEGGKEDALIMKLELGC